MDDKTVEGRLEARKLMERKMGARAAVAGREGRKTRGVGRREASREEEKKHEQSRRNEETRMRKAWRVKKRGKKGKYKERRKRLA